MCRPLPGIFPGIPKQLRTAESGPSVMGDDVFGLLSTISGGQYRLAPRNNVKIELPLREVIRLIQS
jgi:hypothetical protein